MIKGRFLSIILLSAMLIAAGSTGSSEAQVNSSLQQWMTEHYPVSNGRWETWILDSTLGLEALNPEEVRVVKAGQSGKPKKIMNFVLKHKDQQFLVKARVVCFKKVLVARKILQRRTSLDHDDWQIEERASNRVPHDALGIEASLDNYRVKKVLVRGEIITRHAVEKEPAVAKGKRMTLQIKGTGVLIKTDVYSMEEGYIGDWIKVKQCDSGRICRGLIIHPEVTQIELNRRL